MIRASDAATLALTKLRTRKVRLIITIAVSGLLFSALAGASIVARGVMNGIQDFGKEGIGDRYIVQAYPQLGFNFINDTSVIDRAAAIQKEIITQKKAEAKRLGITYDSGADGQPFQEYTNPGGGKVRSLDTNHPAAQQAIKEYLAAHSLPDLETLKKVAKPYDPKNFFTSQHIPYDLKGAQLQVLKGGTESFDQANQTSDKELGAFAGGSGTDTFVSSWSSMSSGLLKPFILPGQNLRIGADGSIPILIPNSAAEQLLGLKSLPATAEPQERLARTREIRDKAPNFAFSACYRNATSADLVRQAIATEQELAKNKNKKDYQKPSLIYGRPATACGAVPIVRDVRPAEEKTAAAKQQEFDQKFGKLPAEQTTLKFRIVGVVPDVEQDGGAVGVGQILRMLVSSSIGSGWFTPTEILAGNPTLTKLFDSQDIYNSPGYFAEFRTAAQAKTFLEKENCKVDYGKLGPNTDLIKYCQDRHQPFSTTAFGNNSLGLEGVKKGFGKFFRIAALVVSLIAAIIMMGTVGRMIADSRRETAVFRAIGAKRLDIAQIYIVYTICLSLLISIFAIIVGLIVALIANYRWSDGVTIQALTAYNAQDLTKVFSLYAFHIPDLLLLVGLSLLAGLLSAALPLFRNLRRNPIRDMRDDT